jgi:dTDP-4-amino-4,6-dideoxygalactose transaminase
MIPYGRQSISAEDIKAVSEALKSDWLTTGPQVERFETKLQTIVGAPTVSVSSGTAALHCAYAAIGLKQDDEVITPPLTFIATQATASMLGAKIVFADVLSDIGTINPEAVEKAISPRTKAIVAVDYAGHPAELQELRTLADKKGIFLIEDAAHSLGSSYRNTPVGAIADLTTFSFFPTKNITTSEGGAVASINERLLEKARLFARQGLVRDKKLFRANADGDWHQEVHEFGLNYRLPDVLCALGISQVGKLAEFKVSRRQIFDKYKEHLEGITGITLPQQRSYVDPMWHLYPIQVPRSRRRQIFDKLRSEGFGVQVNYLPAHLHPVFSKLGYKRGDFPVSEEFYDREISLPMWPGLLELGDGYFEKIATVIASETSKT